MYHYVRTSTALPQVLMYRYLMSRFHFFRRDELLIVLLTYETIRARDREVEGQKRLGAEVYCSVQASCFFGLELLRFFGHCCVRNTKRTSCPYSYPATEFYMQREVPHFGGKMATDIRRLMCICLEYVVLVRSGSCRKRETKNIL